MAQAPVIDGFSTPLAQYRGAAAEVRSSLLYSLGSGAFSCVMLVAGVIGVLTPKHRAGGGVALGLSLVFFVIGLYFLADLLWNWSRRIWLYPEGIVDQSLFAEKSCKWSEVEEIVSAPSLALVTLRKQDSQQIRFWRQEIDRAALLAEEVVQQVLANLVPRLVRRIRSGESVRFGRIEADFNGITIHYRELMATSATSLYQGPWPQDPLLASQARAHPDDTLTLRWDQVGDVEISKESGLLLNANAGPVPLWCGPIDAPNSVALGPVARHLSSGTS